MCINLSFANCLRPAQCFVSNLYVRVLVSGVCDKLSFETFQYGILRFFLESKIYVQQNSSFRQMFTNIPSSMTFTILLGLSRFIFIFASASFCKQSFKIFSKISSHPDRPRSTCIRTCRHVGCCYPLTFDNRGHNYLTTPIKLTYH